MFIGMTNDESGYFLLLSRGKQSASEFPAKTERNIFAADN